MPSTGCRRRPAARRWCRSRRPGRCVCTWRSWRRPAVVSWTTSGPVETSSTGCSPGSATWRWTAPCPTARRVRCRHRPPRAGRGRCARRPRRALPDGRRLEGPQRSLDGVGGGRHEVVRDDDAEAEGPVRTGARLRADGNDLGRRSGAAARRTRWRDQGAARRRERRGAGRCIRSPGGPSAGGGTRRGRGRCFRGRGAGDDELGGGEAVAEHAHERDRSALAESPAGAPNVAVDASSRARPARANDGAFQPGRTVSAREGTVAWLGGSVEEHPLDGREREAASHVGGSRKLNASVVDGRSTLPDRPVGGNPSAPM